MTGGVFDIRRYSIHDGPGIRTTVFLKGCPLRCPWCHNPEGQSFLPEIMLRAGRCLADCAECLAVCKAGALTKEAGAPSLERAACDLCGRCAEVCPTGAIEVVGRRLSPAEVVDEIEKDRVFYEESGGGATFSGGEPLAQADFLAEALRACGRASIHTAVDTCGYAPSDIFLRVAALADLFLFDLKLLDGGRHDEITGQPNAVILENLKLLSGLGKRLIVRLPLVAGVNDGENDTRLAADFLGAVVPAAEISLLPYHKLGLEKLRGLGRKPRSESYSAPSEDTLLRIRRDLEARGFRVGRGE